MKARRADHAARLSGRTRPGACLRAAALTLPLALAGCEGVQSALDPAGFQAGEVAGHGWRMIALTGAAWAAVVVALFVGLLRRGVRPDAGPARAPLPPPDERSGAPPGAAVAVGAATGVSLLLLLFVFVDTLLLERRSARELREGTPVIEVVGYQWWWDVHYTGEIPALRVRTANEIHLPLGRTVELHLRSADVIHSLWIPNVHGKMDLIPGRTNVLRVRAEREGVFRGQCAEFCGMQHALMGLVVVVEPEAEWEAWLARQRQPAAEPTTASAARGREVFETRTCVLCHMVRGTAANATVGPDLTHLASRRTLAAATLANARGQLGGWILGPQHVKPGNHMPPTQLSAEELNALLDYLATLE